MWRLYLSKDGCYMIGNYFYITVMKYFNITLLLLFQMFRVMVKAIRRSPCQLIGRA